MEPANKPPVSEPHAGGQHATAIEFLPDADEIERQPLPAFARRTLHLLAVSLVLSLLWAGFSEVERVVIAQGQLVNPLPNIVVQPIDTSIIQKIEVRVGQVVRKGEVLATLDPTFAQADEAQLRNRLKSLDTQAQGLSAELSGASNSRPAGSKDADGQLQSLLAKERQANFQAQTTRMQENLARLAASLDTSRKDQAVLQQRMKSLSEIEAMQESLVAQQFGAKLQLLEARDRRLSVERDLQMARNKELELNREIASLEAEITAFTKSWRQKAMEDLLSTSRDRDGVNEQLQKADKRKKMVNLVSPIDAVVLEIAKLSEGSIVKEAEQMFTLVPLSSQLEAEVKIDSIDIGYIKNGDIAHLKLDAFPFQKHGALEAKIRTISEDAFRRDTAVMAAGTQTYYISRVAFGDARLRHLPDKFRLLPGMTVTAEIVVGKRSVLSYLLWPLTKALNESIREP